MIRSVWLMLLVMVAAHAQEYRIGQGIKAGTLPLYIGGYVTADFLARDDDYHRLRLDDIALIGYGSHDRFSYLAELEMKESYVREWGKVDKTSHHHRVSIERVYVDYAYSDTTEFRVGKFNTPVGYWNLVPINVLRDSASNPYLASILYPRYTSGIQVSYEDHFGGGNVYSAIVQNNHDIDDGYNNIYIDRHVAGGIEHVGDAFSYKVNVGHFQTTETLKFYYFLLAMQYERERYEIMAELGARKGGTEWTVPYAFYIQGVYHMMPQHDLIGRVESYKIDEGALREEEVGVMGYTYRPLYPVTFKAEYQLHSYTNENQIHLSFSILF